MPKLGWTPGIAEQLRDEAIERVNRNADSASKGQFKRRVLAVILHHDFGKEELVWEDIRKVCEEKGIVPHDPNAWGGRCNALMRAGLLVTTGQWKKTRSAKSHATKSQVFRINRCLK